MELYRQKFQDMIEYPEILNINDLEENMTYELYAIIVNICNNNFFYQIRIILEK